MKGLILAVVLLLAPVALAEWVQVSSNNSYLWVSGDNCDAMICAVNSTAPVVWDIDHEPLGFTEPSKIDGLTSSCFLNTQNHTYLNFEPNLECLYVSTEPPSESTQPAESPGLSEVSTQGTLGGAPLDKKKQSPGNFFISKKSKNKQKTMSLGQGDELEFVYDINWSTIHIALTRGNRPINDITFDNISGGYKFGAFDNQCAGSCEYTYILTSDKPWSIDNKNAAYIHRKILTLEQQEYVDFSDLNNPTLSVVGNKLIVNFISNGTIDPTLTQTFRDSSDKLPWLNGTEKTNLGVRLDAPVFYMNFNNPPEPQLAKELLIHYNMETDTSLVAVDAMGNNNGTIVDDYAYSPIAISAKIGNGLDLEYDGDTTFVDTYVITDNNVGISGTSSRAISMWVYPSTTVQMDFVLWSGMNISINPDGSGLNVTVGADVTSLSSFISGAAWQHVVVSYSDDGTLRIWKDGTLINTTTGHSWNTADGQMVIFNGDDYAAFSYGAIFDDFRVYNRSLTQADVDAIYNGSSGTQTIVGNYLRENSLNNFYMVKSTSYAAPEYIANCGSPAGGGCFSFTGGNDWYTTDALSSTIFNSGDWRAVTVSAWVYPTSFPTYGDIVRRNNGAGEGQFHMRAEGQDLRWQVMESDGDASAMVISNLFPSTDQWYHLVGVWNGTDILVYVNGELNATQAATTVGRLNTVGSDLSIGGYGTTGGEGYEGYIDNVQIWKRALSADEVLNLYNGTGSGNPDNRNNSNYIGTYAYNGDFKSMVFFNSSSTYWNTTLSIADSNGTWKTKDLCDADSNCVSYWPLDFNYSDMKGANEGSCINCPNNATGISSNSMFFEGYFSSKTDFIQIPDDSSLKGFSSMSLSLWVYDPHPGSSPLYQVAGLVDKNRVTEWSSILSAHNVYLQGASTDGSFTFHATDFPTDEWVHLVFVYNGSDKRIYYNGVSQAVTEDGAGVGNISSGTNPVYIGKLDDGYQYDGELDEILLFNSSLSTSEVLALYKAGLSQHSISNVTFSTRTANTYNITDSNLVGFWPLNGNVTDMSANSNDGTPDGLTLTNDSVVGQAYSFDGLDDGILVGDTDALTLSSFSVSTWVKTTHTASGYNMIVSKGDRDNTIEYYIGTPFGEVYFRSYDGTERHGIAMVGDGKWHHIVVTATDGDQKIYVDSQLDSSFTDSFSTSNTGDSLTIGYEIWMGSPNARFDGIIDELRIYNRTLSATEVQSLYELGSVHITDWSAWSSETDAKDGVPITSSSSGNFMQYRATMKTNDTDPSPYIIGHTVEDVEINAPPTVTNINWRTTGGFTDSTLIYNQVLDYINATCNDTDGVVLWCNLTVRMPNSTKLVDNLNMTNNSGIWTNTTDITLNQVGTWNISITDGDDGGLTGTAYSTFTVSTVTQTLVTGFFGYDTQTIPDLTMITDLASYDYELIEIQDNASTISTDWSNVKTAIDNCNDTNLRVGLIYYLDYNLSNTTQVNLFKNNITANFPDLLLQPYSNVVSYIQFVAPLGSFNNTTIYTNNLNVLGKAAFDATGNKFAILSDSDNILLENAYIDYNLIPHLSGANESDLMNTIAAWSRNTSVVKRVYYNLDATLKAESQRYFNDVTKLLTDVPNSSIAINLPLVGELDNGDLIIHNNATARSFSYNLSNGTNTAGKDLWDYTRGVLVANNTHGDIVVIPYIPSYSAILIGTRDLDHIAMDDLDTGTAFEQTAATVYNSNYTDGTREGASDASTTRAIELWDGSYTAPKAQVFYGWLNTTLNPWDYDGLDYLIIADKNNAEVDKLFNGTATIGGIFGYISVADYNSSNATWLSGKEAEVDSWLALNGSMDIFFDGLDAASIDNPTAFQQAIQNLTDYVKIDKAREVAVNVFTNYTSFAGLASNGGFAMKESCGSRWVYANGVNASNGYNYTDENFDEGTAYDDYTKALWYNGHNITILCVAFVDRNNTAYTPDGTNYTNMKRIFLKDAVLGYEYIIFQTPYFSLNYYDRLYDLGNKLQRQPTVSGDLYSMRYSKGIVYFNSTSNQSWFDDGLQFNNASVSINLFDDVAHTYDVKINNYPYSITTAGDGFSYDWHTIYLNETVFNESAGHYNVTVYSSDGGYVGDDQTLATIRTYGKHSFYNNSGAWALESTATGNHMVNLMTNLSHASSIGTTNKILQTESTTNYVTSVAISSDYYFNSTVWSYWYNIVAGALQHLKVYNGSSWIDVTYQNTVTCITVTPSFFFNTIAGLGQIGACIDNTTSVGVTYVRFSVPRLGTPITDVSDTNLVAYWNLDSNYLDSSSNSNDGTCINCPSNISGIINNAMYFNGVNNNVIFSDSPSLDISSNLSISLWVKRTGKDDYVILISKDDGVDRSWALDLGPIAGAQGKPRFYLNGGSSDIIVGDTILQLNKWYNLVGVYTDSGTLSLYVNGVLDKTQSGFSTSIPLTNVDVYIGSYGSGSYPFEGILDEVRIYNKSLTQAEITTLYNRGLQKQVKFEIDADNVPPTINWNWADANTIIDHNDTKPCVTSDELVNCTFSFNGTNYLNATYGTSICYSLDNLPDGNYSTISVTCKDYNNNSDTTINVWLDVDTTSPVITWWWGDINSTIANNWTVVRVNTSESSTCNFDFNGTIHINSTLGLTSSHNVTGLADGNYSTINVTCEDSVGNSNTSDNAWVKVKTTSPILIWDWSDANHTTTWNTSVACVNLSEPGSCAGFYIPNGTGGIDVYAPIITDPQHFCWNLTGPAGGDGYPNGNWTPINASCQDLIGNSANTSNVWWVVDSVMPIVNITSPIVGALSNDFALNITWNASDTHLESCWWTDDSGATNNSVVCNTTLSGPWISGLNNITIYANDTAGNEGNDTVWFTIDAVAAPLFWNWTDINSTLTGQSWTYICINSSETLASCTFNFNGTAHVNTTNDANICHNITGLIDGNYSTINATCIDLYSNSNTTDNTWLQITNINATGDLTYTWTVPATACEGVQFNAAWSITPNVGSTLSAVNLVNASSAPSGCTCISGCTYYAATLNTSVSANMRFSCPGSYPHDIIATLTYTNGTGAQSATLLGIINIQSCLGGGGGGGGSGEYYTFVLHNSTIVGIGTVNMSLVNEGFPFLGTINATGYCTPRYIQKQILVGTNKIEIVCNYPATLALPRNETICVNQGTINSCAQLTLLPKSITTPTGYTLALPTDLLMPILFFVIFLILIKRDKQQEKKPTRREVYRD